MGLSCAGGRSRQGSKLFFGIDAGRPPESGLFPLGTMQKKHVCEALEQRGMPVPAPGESQEICFVPHDDYRAFLRTTGIRLPEGGPMVTGEGLVVGRHQGLWQYTEGQRRGLAFPGRNHYMSSARIGRVTHCSWEQRRNSRSAGASPQKSTCLCRPSCGPMIFLSGFAIVRALCRQTSEFRGRPPHPHGC